MSSRTGDKDAIGHKGIGTKSYFLSNHGLIVVTKTKADADWACLQLANPMEWLLSATSTSQASAHLWMLAESRSMQLCREGNQHELSIHQRGAHGM